MMTRMRTVSAGESGLAPAIQASAAPQALDAKAKGYLKYWPYAAAAVVVWFFFLRDR